jgi:hypothetical protein
MLKNYYGERALAELRKLGDAGAASLTGISSTLAFSSCLLASFRSLWMTSARCSFLIRVSCAFVCSAKMPFCRRAWRSGGHGAFTFLDPSERWKPSPELIAFDLLAGTAPLIIFDHP